MHCIRKGTSVFFFQPKAPWVISCKTTTRSRDQVLFFMETKKYYPTHYYSVTFCTSINTLIETTCSPLLLSGLVKLSGLFELSVYQTWRPGYLNSVALQSKDSDWRRVPWKNTKLSTFNNFNKSKKQQSALKAYKTFNIPKLFMKRWSQLSVKFQSYVYQNGSWKDEANSVSNSKEIPMWENGSQQDETKPMW